MRAVTAPTSPKRSAGISPVKNRAVHLGRPWRDDGVRAM